MTIRTKHSRVKNNSQEQLFTLFPVYLQTEYKLMLNT